MANKKDLIEAQGFSRRRLLTAFTSGAPGGKELEPAKPLRAVFAGVALSVMVIVGGLFYGLMKPALPEGWDNNTIIIAKDTGARYVAFDGTLFPVLNATSARLLLPADKYKPIVTTSKAISKAPIGQTIGILGAPDDVPKASALVADGWTACPSTEGTAVSIPGDAVAAPTPTAALVTNDGHEYVVTGDTAYLVDDRARDAVLRAVGLVGIKPTEVDSTWLNLFKPGANLTPMEIEGAGDVLEGTDLVVGMAVQVVNSTDAYIVTADGKLAPLSPLALQLWGLGTGAGRSVADVSQAEIQGLGNAAAAGGVDWPKDVLAPVAPGTAVCAMLGHDALLLPTTTLATTVIPPAGDGVTVTPGAGALVGAGGEGTNGVSEVFLIDQTGTSYGIPDDSPEVLGRLGYTADADVAVLTTAWMQFFASGPELTIEAAGASLSGDDGSGLPSASPEPTSAVQPSATPSPSPLASGAPSPSVQPSGEAAAADAVAPKECERGSYDPIADPAAPLSLLQQPDIAQDQVATGEGVVVAVVDSGIDVENAHLADQVIGGINLVADGEREDGMSDLSGHGTSVAGAIAAAEIENSESGVVGLAPGAKLLAVRVFRDDGADAVKAGFGPDDLLMAEGIVWAVDNGATIVNVSMSSTVDRPEFRQAVEYATSHGVLVVASAGNRNTATDTTNSPRYPAAVPGALSVTATNLEGDVTEASIHGPHVEVAAPAQHVSTAYAGGLDCEFAGDAESSSYATAYVSAAAALVAQVHPDETPDQWSYRLMASAIRVDPEVRDDLAGWGVIQPLDAIRYVPGPEERGPESPFVATAPVTVPLPTVPVVSRERVSPFVETRHLATGVAIVAAAALGALGVLVTYRRRPQGDQAPDAWSGRTGLLDAQKADLTRMR